MLHFSTRSLLTAGLLACGLVLTFCAIRPDPKYAPDKYFDQPYRSAAGAIWRGDEDDLEDVFVRKGLQVNHIGKGNHSLLLYSLSCKNYKAVEFLLAQGADPNLVNPDSSEFAGEMYPHPLQPVEYAANDEDPAGLKALLEAGGDPNSKTGKTPAIHRAEVANRLENIEILLDHGANIEGRDGTGRTPLLHAGYLTDWDMVWFFIDEGANWRVYDMRGVTLALIIQEEIAKDIGTEEYRRELQKLKSFLERKDVEFPVKRVEVSEAAKEKMKQGLPPDARVDPKTGQPLDSAQTPNKTKGNTPDIFREKQRF